MYFSGTRAHTYVSEYVHSHAYTHICTPPTHTQQTHSHTLKPPPSSSGSSEIVTKDHKLNSLSRSFLQCLDFKFFFFNSVVPPA